MTTYGAIKATATRAPLRTVVVRPSAFQDTWPDRPHCDVAIGLRLLAQEDNERARAAASKHALELHEPDDGEGLIEAYNDTLMALAVARGACDPNDVSQPYFPMADDTVPIALTSEGIRYVYQALERMHLEESPLWPAATDLDLRSLVVRISRGNVADLPVTVQKRVRRLLAFCLAEVGGPVGDIADEDDDTVTVTPPSFIPAT